MHSLGVLLYLVDSGANKYVTSIVSVSGGSIANACASQDQDFTTVSPTEFRATAARLARFIINRGLIPSLPVYLFLGFLIVLGLILIVGPFLLSRLGVSPWTISLGWLPLASGFFTAILLRGMLVEFLLKRAFFSRPSGRSAQLRDLSPGVDHTFCATDLNLGLPFYFTSSGGGMVYSDGLGWGDFAEDWGVGLETVVRSSAAFPGMLPPKFLSGTLFRFWRDPMFRARPQEEVGGAFLLADGGVWNNLGTDWWDSSHGDSLLDWRAFAGAIGSRRLRTYAQRSPQVRIVVNSSSPLHLRRRSRVFTIPVAAELIAPRRVVGTLYHNTVRPRLAALSRRTGRLSLQSPAAATVPPGKSDLPGTGAFVDAGPIVVELSDNPRFKWFNWLWNKRLVHEENDEPRLRHAMQGIKERREVWGEAMRRAGFAAVDSEEGVILGWPDKQALEIPTTLGKLPRDVAVSLMMHGYLDAMGGLYTLYDLPLLRIPDRTYFESLVDEGADTAVDLDMVRRPDIELHTIQLDLTRLAGNLANVNLSSIGTFSSHSVVSVKVLPKLSYILSSAGGQVSFTVGDDGTVDYYDHLDGTMLAGRATARLEVLGIPIVVDATALKGQFSLASVGTFPCEVPQRLRLLPGYQKFEHPDLEFTFGTWKSVVDYERRLDKRLSGRGSTTLTVTAILPKR